MICSVVKELGVDFPEHGTAEIKLYFRDQEGTPIIPSTLFYSLVNEEDEIINDLDDIPLELASEVSVFLTGDDLSLSVLERSTGWAYRYLTITGTYNEGPSSGLQIAASSRFKVCAIRHGGGF